MKTYRKQTSSGEVYVREVIAHPQYGHSGILVKPWGTEPAGSWIGVKDFPASWTEVAGNTCDCGGHKARTTHSHWCSTQR